MNGDAAPPFPIQIGFETRTFLFVEPEDDQTRAHVVRRAPTLRVALPQEFDQFPVSRALFADHDVLSDATVGFRARGLEALGADDDSDVVRL